MFDICVIGGGASAMAAVITAKQQNPHTKICIYEKKEILGKKLMATGNGKCNMTNTACPRVKETLEFFSNLGIITRQDDEGRVYPYSERAKEVVYGLQRQIEASDIIVFLNHEISKVEAEEGRFTVTGKHGTEQARQVLIAAGGKAGPQFGTTGDGYRFAKAMGHSIRKAVPVLAAMEIDGYSSDLKGVRAKAKIHLFRKGTEIAEEQGEVQFTSDGLSGICIFNLTRFVKLDEKTAFGDYSLKIDFMPNMGMEQIRNFLQERTKLEQILTKDLLLSVVAKPLAKKLLSGCDMDLLAEQLPGETLDQLAAELKGWKQQLSGVKGWRDAQCTAGGVSMGEIQVDTMESKLVPGLYFAGEVIDYDGPCGGFNLQNAWETGIKAGRAMAHV